MLRRKFILALAPLVGLLLLAALASIWLLEGVITDFDEVIARTWPEAEHVKQLAEITAQFRGVVLLLALVFLVVINISVITLLYLGGMVLRPVEKLVDGTRKLAEEKFDHRVQVDQRDEFGLLAASYNAMAERLQASEQRKMEMLQQVALALNHELNNAIAIIELQLRILSKQTPGSAAPERCLRQIHESLRRMTTTVQQLKSVRRIVLTDYIPGMKMLDLQRSSQEDQEPTHPHSSAPPTPKQEEHAPGWKLTRNPV